MNPKKVDEIMAKVVKVWEKRHGKGNIDPEKIKDTRQVLLMSPHDDGIMPVQTIDADKTHGVPIEYIILNGLNGSDVDKFPEIK